jgi:calcineurin-like phosphoesterase family protein
MITAVRPLPGQKSIEAYVDNPGQIPYKKLLNIIKNEDPYISADYHLLKEKLIVDDNKKEKEEENRTEKIIKLHNAKVKKDDYFLMLGDIQEGELREGNDLLELVVSINRLHGKKILLCGNNDTQRWDFYVKAGFIFVTRSPIINENYMFSHEPVDILSIGVKKNYLNLCGHIHRHRTYYNMDNRNHINVYWEDFNGPLRLSEYIRRYNNNELPKCKSIYQ